MSEFAQFDRVAAERPLPFIRVVDLETTGFEPPEHRPVEIGWCDVRGGFDLFGEPTFGNGVAIMAPQARLCDPGRPVPPETSAVHHLVDDDLAGTAPWRTEMIRAGVTVTCKSAFAAHSAKFETQWCTPELVGPEPWVCTWKCALRAWPDAPGHGNQVLRYWLKPEGLDRDLATPAHRAGPDAYATAFLLRELLALHPLATLLVWSAEPAVLIRVPFGKRPEEGGWRGCKWTEVDDGFLWWVVERDFSEDIRHTVKLEMARREAMERAQAAADELAEAPF